MIHNRHYSNEGFSIRRHLAMSADIFGRPDWGRGVVSWFKCLQTKRASSWHPLSEPPLSPRRLLITPAHSIHPASHQVQMTRLVCLASLLSLLPGPTAPLPGSDLFLTPTACVGRGLQYLRGSCCCAHVCLCPNWTSAGVSLPKLSDQKSGWELGCPETVIRTVGPTKHLLYFGSVATTWEQGHFTFLKVLISWFTCIIKTSVSPVIRVTIVPTSWGLCEE